MTPAPRSPWSVWWKLLVAIIALKLILAGYLGWRLQTDEPVDYADIQDHFKYGSTGGERTSGLPYSVWKVLPTLFPEYLPGPGYESLGFLYETGKDLPIGVSKRRFAGIDLVYFNCAICHAGAVRDTPEAHPRFYPAMPSNTVNLRGFFEFLFNIAADAKFTPLRILAEMERQGLREDWINRMALRYMVVYLMRDQVLDRRQRLKFILDQPDFGPGRVDTFSPAKALLNFRMDKAAPNEMPGTVDFPSIWMQRERQGMQLHWDGNNTRVEERNRSAAFGTGATPPTLDRPRIRRIEDWLLDFKPPAYPYALDRVLAARGAPHYAQYCANCHGRSGRDFRNGAVGKVTPIGEIGTDRQRLDSYTYDLAVNQNLLYAGWGDERFSHFRKTNGYANMPLDGVWLRAPYLHNGSVPTLRDLLEPAKRRPPVFYRGDDVYEPKNVGFVSNVTDRNGRRFFRFDTAVRGNSNKGHEGAAYGTDLAATDKDALVEFLKTF